MKLGLLADIHGNCPALEAVLADAPAVDMWLCMGDVVGYYPDVNEVCRILMDIRAMVVRGNHDAYVTGQLIPDQAKREIYRTDWSRAHLQPEYLHWLGVLPVEIKFCYKSTQITIRHASPWDEETYLYPDSPLLKKIELERDHFFLFGHSHYPMRTQANEGYLINPGSVGQPRDYKPAPSYAIFNLISGIVEHRRVEYDVAAYQKRLAESGWPEQVISILSRSR